VGSVFGVVLRVLGIGALMAGGVAVAVADDFGSLKRLPCGTYTGEAHF
jgi:hypothetical protein